MTASDQMETETATKPVSEAEKVSRRRQVFEALVGMHNMDVSPIRTENLMSQTGLTRQQVSDAIKDLEFRGEIVKPVKGQYEPVYRHPPSQAVSVTALPDGTRLLEKGDMVMTLTPFEFMYELAPLVAGASAQALVMQYVEQMQHIAAKNVRLEREVNALKAHTKFQEDKRQMDLI
jgi:hypothetical protein